VDAVQERTTPAGDMELTVTPVGAGGGAGASLLEQPENITTSKIRKIVDVSQRKVDLPKACAILFSIISPPFYENIALHPNM
jgi:hypothetical protein